MKIGQKVIRLDGGYTAGRTGTVIAIDAEKQRARVEWDGAHPKTWVRFSSLNQVDSSVQVQQ